VIPSLRENIQIEGNGQEVPNVLAYGWVPGSVVFNHLNLVSGETLKKTHYAGIMLGAGLAANLDVKVGDKVMIFGTDEFEIVGIFKSPNVFENGALIVALPDLQDLLDTKGNVTSFDLMLDKPGDQALVQSVRHEVERIAPGVTITPTREHVDKLSEIRVARAMAWIISAIALVIGTVGTLNTMFMSVHERTREIGILRAIGWRKSRVMRMVLSESVVLSTVGGLVGVALAFLMLQFLTRLPAASGFIVRYIEPGVVLEGLAIAVLMGLLGGILPARSAARMQPVKAIHYQ
jgi:putative ABC transport system permease protein